MLLIGEGLVSLGSLVEKFAKRSNGNTTWLPFLGYMIEHGRVAEGSPDAGKLIGGPLGKTFVCKIALPICPDLVGEQRQIVRE